MNMFRGFGSGFGRGFGREFARMNRMMDNDFGSMDHGFGFGGNSFPSIGNSS